MGEKINNVLKGEIISSVFYILLGLCLILIPTQTVDVICKVVFGLILIGVGIYHIYIYIRGKATATGCKNITVEVVGCYADTTDRKGN